MVRDFFAKAAWLLVCGAGMLLVAAVLLDFLAFALACFAPLR